jgi:protein gp37
VHEVHRGGDLVTSIEWADETWNPTVGCSRVSPGCDGCYAIGVAHRAMQPAHRGLTVVTDRGPDWTGEVRQLPERLATPLRWRRPRRVFVDSMSDLFHPDVPDAFLVEVFATMALGHQHTFQLLTKRPQRMEKWLADSGYAHSLVNVAISKRLGVNPADHGPYRSSQDVMRLGEVIGRARREAGLSAFTTWPLPNVWLGTSIESDRYAFRADLLRRTPAAVRWLSLEPLLGPLPSLSLEGVDWVVVGGESGPRARPMHPEWARDIRNRCVAAGIPFLFKQWGTWRPLTGSGDGLGADGHVNLDGTYGDPSKPEFLHPGAEMIVRPGKKAAGRELDGRTWDQYPEAVG